MGRLFLLLLTILLFNFALAEKVDAQTFDKKAKLNQLSKSYSDQFQQQKAEALEKARTMGIPIRQEFENGRVVELMKFRNGKPIYYTTFNNEGGRLLKNDQVYPGGVTAVDLTGYGQIIGLWDAGVPLLNHDELTGRVTSKDGTTDENSHATHVAGTLAASGSDIDAKGMAFEASVDSYSFNNDLGEMSTAASNGLLVSVHPYGFPAGWDYGKWNGTDTGWYWWGDKDESESSVFGFYDNEASQWDDLAYTAPNYLIVVSAGNDRGEGPASGADHWAYDNNTDKWVFINDGTVRELDGGSFGYDTISSFALSKNVMTVGALGVNQSGSDLIPYMWNESGWGPTDDGRIKPDIVAKGVGVYSSSSASVSSYASDTGTSFSAPMIAGSAALLIEYQEDLDSEKTLLSSTVKGLILHTSDDLGNTGPDYEFGWGLMNTQEAVQVMKLNHDYGGIHIKELTIHENQSITIPIKAKGGEPLRVTIAWTDPPATPLATDPYLNPPDPMLVNDLDIQLEDQSATISQSYILDPSNPGNPATTGDNDLDNVEMIHIDSPNTGELYTLTISHEGSLTNNSQDFSLIITGNVGVDYKQQITEGNGEGWRFLSSPVSTSYLNLLHPLWTQGVPNSDNPSASVSNVLVYNGTGYVSVDNLTSTMDTGSGVAVYVYEDDDFDQSADGWPKTLTVNGMENLNDVDVTHLLNPGSLNNYAYTLLGNPYPSTIDFDEFTNQNDLGGVVYVYDHTCSVSDPLNEPGNGSGGCFLAWSSAGSGSGSLSGGLIAPFQGFYVFADGGSPTLTIPTSAKTTGGTFYKENDEDATNHASIQLLAKLNGNISNSTWLSFNEDGSMDKNRFDAPYLYPLDYKPFLSLRTEIDNTGYLIKNLPLTFDHPVEIPITIEAWQPSDSQQSAGFVPMGGDVELVWPALENIPENWTVTLTDHHNGTVTDMRKSSSYHLRLQEERAKNKALSYSMNIKTAEIQKSSKVRFTLTIYPEPLVNNQLQETPSDYSLEQNYPNPFNPTTVIRYTLPEASDVELEIYTIDGQKVATLVNESKNAGNYTVTFDGFNLSSGIYIYRLATNQQTISRKMVLIK